MASRRNGPNGQLAFATWRIHNNNVIYNKRRKKMQKRNGLCSFDKAKPEGHIHLTAF